MTKTFDDVMASAKPAERTVALCLRGDLVARFEDLERELLAEMKRPQTSLGTTGNERAIAEQIEALRAEMEEHEVVFRFRGLPARQWSDLMGKHPSRPGKDEAFNVDTFPDALLAACCLEPVMTPEQVKQLGDTLTDGQYAQLFDCAWSVNRKAVDVPFSVAASRLLRDSETS